jgi:hypothetical protein
MAPKPQVIAPYAPKIGAGRFKPPPKKRAPVASVFPVVGPGGYLWGRSPASRIAVRSYPIVGLGGHVVGQTDAASHQLPQSSISRHSGAPRCDDCARAEVVGRPKPCAREGARAGTRQSSTRNGTSAPPFRGIVQHTLSVDHVQAMVEHAAARRAMNTVASRPKK